MMPLGGLFLFEAMVLAVGLLVVRMLLPGKERHPAELWLPVAFAVGLTIHAMTLIGSLTTVGRVSAWTLPILAVIAIVIQALCHRSGRLAPIGGFAFLRRSGSANSAAFYWLLVFIVLGRIVMLHAEALRFPLYTWDGRFIWNYKAMILFHEGTVFSDSFMDPSRVHFHRDYPLLLPGAYLGIYQATGGVFERMARLFLVHVMVLFLMAFHGSLRSRCEPWLAMLFTAFLAAAAFRIDYTVRDGISLTTGVADIPFAFFAFLAVVLHMRGWQTREWRWHVLGGIMTGACLLTKSEGLVALAAISGGNLIAALASRGISARQKFTHFGITVGVPILVTIQWLLLKASLHNFYDEKFSDLIVEAGFSPIIERLPRVLQLISSEALSTRSWNLAWPAFIAATALLLLAKFRVRRFHAALVVLLWLPAYVLAYLITPLEIGYHVETSIGRLLSHFHALALLQIALAFGLWIRWGRTARRPVESPSSVPN